MTTALATSVNTTIGASAGLTFTVTLPTISNGTVMIMGVGCFGNNNLTTPSGWTLIAMNGTGTTSTSARLYTFWKTFNNDGTSVNITMSRQTQAAAVVAIPLIADSVAPINAHSVSSGNTNTPTSTAVTVTKSGCSGIIFTNSSTNTISSITDDVNWNGDTISQEYPLNCYLASKDSVASGSLAAVVETYSATPTLLWAEHMVIVNPVSIADLALGNTITALPPL